MSLISNKNEILQFLTSLRTHFFKVDLKMEMPVQTTPPNCENGLYKKVREIVYTRVDGKKDPVCS